jgi:hypothetical protein
LWARRCSTPDVRTVDFFAASGALIAQPGPKHGDVVHVFVLDALLMMIGWLLTRVDAAVAGRA